MATVENISFFELDLFRYWDIPKNDVSYSALIWCFLSTLSTITSHIASHHFSTVVSSVFHRQCSEFVRSCSVCSAPTPASKESRRRVRSRSKSPFRSFRWKKTKTSPSEAPGSASDDESNLERAAGNFFYFVKVEGAPRHCFWGLVSLGRTEATKVMMECLWKGFLGFPQLTWWMRLKVLLLQS